MAEETLLLKLQLQVDSKNAKTISDLVKEQKKLAKLIKEAPREGTEEYKKFEKTLDAAKKQYAENAAEIKKFNKELKTGVKETEATEDSLKGLSKSLKALEKEYKNLSAEERKTARGRELQKQIVKTRKELLKAEKSLGDFRRQVGNYTRSLVTLNSGIAGVAVSVGSLVSGLGGLVNAFRNAGTAAKAFLLTLGPISIAIAAITFALSKFQSVIDTVKTAVAGISAAFDVVVERIGRFGQALGKLASFDFSGFSADAQNAFSGIGEEISREAQAAAEFTRQLQQLRDDEINSIVTLADLELQIAEKKRKSQELETKNRKAAANEIEDAIALVEKQGDIELSLARRRRDILAAQVAQTDELTNAEDRRNLEEQRAKVLRLEVAIENELRGLIRRRELLNKTVDDGNKKQIDALEKLRQRQTLLTNAIKLQLLAGEDVTENLKELQEVTTALLEVDNKFKELTEDTTDAVTFASGSIAEYNKQLSELNDELETVNTESERYAEIQRQIAQIEAQRAVAIGEIQENLEQLNKTQMQNIAILEDSETALRLRADALREIQALEGSADEIAQKRLEIETKLDSDLRQLRANRINDEKEALSLELAAIDTNLNEQLKLFADNEIKKQELQLIAQGKRDEIRKRELELEKELLDIGKKEFDQSEKAKTASTRAQEERRKQLRDIALDASVEAGKKIVELISVIQQQATDQQLEQIDKREEAELKEAELLGKTEEEKQRIRDKFLKERERIEKQAAQERKALAIAEATIDIAGAVIKSLNSPPPANVALAAATAALGAIQLAIIAATNFADGGLVMPVALENGKIVNTPNIKEMRNGDNILATVRTGEVILNERQQKALGGPEVFKSIGVPGFSTGGKVNLEPIAKTLPFASGGMIPRFSQSVVMASAYQSGGVAAVSATQSVRNAIDKEQKQLIDSLAKAVFAGTLQGSKQGTENADITNQIRQQNKRDARRNQNESF